MTEFTKEFCKLDPEVMGKLFDKVKGVHKPADHTEKVLYENRHTKDFCEMARHFLIMKGKPDLFLHYDVSSWYKHPRQILIRIDAIGVYDDFMEYETARMKGLHSGRNADIPNIN